MNEKSAASTLREKTIRHTSEGWGGGAGGCALYSFREEIKPIGYEA